MPEGDGAPAYVTDEMLVYLDDLRAAGTVNMFGAVPYVEGEFPALTREQARGVLVYWMHTFPERHAEGG